MTTWYARVTSERPLNLGTVILSAGQYIQFSEEHAATVAAMAERGQVCPADVGDIRGAAVHALPPATELDQLTVDRHVLAEWRAEAISELIAPILVRKTEEYREARRAARAAGVIDAQSRLLAAKERAVLEAKARAEQAKLDAAAAEEAVGRLAAEAEKLAKEPLPREEPPKARKPSAALEYLNEAIAAAKAGGPTPPHPAPATSPQTKRGLAELRTEIAERGGASSTPAAPADLGELQAVSDRARELAKRTSGKDLS